MLEREARSLLVQYRKNTLFLLSPVNPSKTLISFLPYHLLPPNYYGHSCFIQNMHYFHIEI